jgi:hypothetical protein
MSSVPHKVGPICTHTLAAGDVLAVEAVLAVRLVVVPVNMYGQFLPHKRQATMAGCIQNLD